MEISAGDDNELQQQRVAHEQLQDPSLGDLDATRIAANAGMPTGDELTEARPAEQQAGKVAGAAVVKAEIAPNEFREQDEPSEREQLGSQPIGKPVPEPSLGGKDQDSGRKGEQRPNSEANEQDEQKPVEARREPAEESPHAESAPKQARADEPAAAEVEPDRDPGLERAEASAGIDSQGQSDEPDSGAPSASERPDPLADPREVAANDEQATDEGSAVPPPEIYEQPDGLSDRRVIDEIDGFIHGGALATTSPEGENPTPENQAEADMEVARLHMVLRGIVNEKKEVLYRSTSPQGGVRRLIAVRDLSTYPDKGNVAAWATLEDFTGDHSVPSVCDEEGRRMDFSLIAHINLLGPKKR